MDNMDVTIDRNKYIGGSDIPIIMGLSPFKTRWELLQEKAGLIENDFEGNRYTEYGNIMEPKIREFINEIEVSKFKPDMKISGDIRCHVDGLYSDTILEIKTTSNIHDTVNEYKIYLVQLLLYMDVYNVDYGLLAVYSRPADFNEEFDAKRLRVFNIDREAYRYLLIEIYKAIECFRNDLNKLRANPLLTEADLMPKEVTDLAEKLLSVENYIKELKHKEKEYESVKKALYESMCRYNIKSFVGIDGSKITKVDEVPAKEYRTLVFDEDVFKCENEALYAMYTKEVTKKKAGRKGYVKITFRE